MNFLDTNIIVRFLLADKNKKYRGVYNLFRKIEEGYETVECPVIIFFQVIFVLKSVYKVDKKLIIQSMLSLLRYRNLRVDRKATLERTLHIWQKQKMEDIVDCYLIACLEEKKEAKLYSYDEDFDKIKSIKRTEP